MWGNGGSRKPEGFHNKHFSDDEGSTQWNGKDYRNRPKISFKMKNQTQQRGKDVGRHMKLAIKEAFDENLIMSVGSDNDSREVAIQKSGFKGRRCNWNGALFHSGGMRSQPYKPVSVMSGSDRYPTSNNPSHGFRITIPYGNKYDKEFLLNTLHNLIAPETFVPIMYKETDRFAVFYVDDQRISEKLLSCDKKVTGPDGFKMQVRVAPGFPRYELDQVLKDKMTVAIGKKFIPEKNALDLSRFHHNPDLVDDYYCSLTRGPILFTALKIVTSAIPTLVEISLDNNQLHSLEKLYPLIKLPNLKILGICDNKIKEMDQLNALKNFKLEELRLAGNPVSQKYNGCQDEYVSDIRKRLPDLLRLDGVVLRVEIGFDVANDRIVLPPAQRLFSPNERAQQIASTFLQQYFLIFDSENRQPLLDAYDEHACFSMSTSLAYGDNKLGTYLPVSRNLCKVLDETRRRKLLKQGRLPVVACISELPRMQHDLSSFTMDIGLVTEKMMMVTITGIFKELEDAGQPIRYFTRTFIITPKGEGYCIINEMLQIIKPTKRQQQEAFRLNQSSTTTASVPAPEATAITDDIRSQMTAALRERTKMTPEWTLKCLNDVQWDFNMALAAFQECQNRGDIPPDAFEK